MKNKIMKRKPTFREVVEITPEISGNYKAGLSALGSYSGKIIVLQKSKLDGSVDIDKSTRTLYPNDSRWDYCFGYKSEIYFIEIHTANTTEVKVVLKKLAWLKNWLVTKAPELNKLKAKNNCFVWIQSNNFSIPKHTPQYRSAISKGILPVKELKLN
jgi:hypothetical protein